MIEGKSVLAVVPARGGSKGVPLKNLHPLKGRPLIAHVGDLVRQVPIIDRVVVSTDSEAIAREAKASGIDAPFLRPESLSGDRIADHPVILHAHKEMERIDQRRYDIVVMLQPTCPQRKPEHVSAAIEMLVRDKRNAVWTVSPADLKYHPLKALTVAENSEMGYYDLSGGDTIVARQQLTPVFYRNGAAYAITREALQDATSMKPENSGAVVIEDALVSIDTLDDFRKLEQIL